MRPFPTARHPIPSLLQAAAAAIERRTGDAGAALRAAVDALVAGAVPAAPAGAAGPQTCAALGLDLLAAAIAGNDAARAVAEDRLAFSACDPGWAAVLVDYAARFAPGGIAAPIPYRPWRAPGDFVVPAPSASMRIGLLSDWGTGTAEARRVAAVLALRRPDAVFHLGDIYYAGTREECDAHFLAPLREAMPEARLFALCGNHDVYSGGGGYYDLLDRIGQPASYFCLRAPDLSWQILAADTGLHDRDPFTVDTAPTRIEPREVEWHLDKMRGFPGRTVLLTHHQPFSAFARIGPAARHDPTNPALLDAHARLAAAGPVDAWFWGHEHSLRLYAPYRGVTRGRNVGFGAIPVGATGTGPPATLPGLVDPPASAPGPALDVVDGAYAHGFALLDIDPGGIEASYWAVTRPDGPIHRERIAPGAPDPAAAMG